MPTLEQLQKLLPEDPDKQDDPVPYDPNAGTLTNIGRFLVNNMATGPALPASGSMKLIGEAAPEIAEALSSAATKEAPAATEAITSGVNKWAPIAQPSTQDAQAAVNALGNDYSPSAIMKMKRLQNILTKGQ